MEQLLWIELISENKARVTGIHHQPSLLSSEKKSKGILITDPIPQAEKKIGKIAFLYVNPQTKDMWYEYVDDGQPKMLNKRSLGNLFGLVRGSQIFKSLKDSVDSGLGPIPPEAIQLLVELMDEPGSIESPGGVDLKHSDTVALVNAAFSEGIINDGEANVILEYGGWETL